MAWQFDDPPPFYLPYDEYLEQVKIKPSSEEIRCAKWLAAEQQLGYSVGHAAARAYLAWRKENPERSKRFWQLLRSGEYQPGMSL